ncbi:MAG: hypothetical protein QOI10_1221 [Solirubrobacterales bacterium]|nr:hypothetical protein [Solirubrobacterales bacterium]
MSATVENAVDRGYFPAGESVLRRVHGERAVGLNYGQRALMLGAAHPVNFIGTQANTRSGARPFLRLAHTAKVFETVFFGTRAEADKALAFVERMHQRVRGEIPESAGRWPAGTSYSAFDPELMLWTVAVIADSAEVFYETLVRDLEPAEKEALWGDYVRFGELFGMPRDAAPSTYAEFRSYWDAIWAGDELHLTDEAREVALAIAFEIPMPRYLHASRRVHNLVLAGTLPSQVRKLFGVDWTPLHEAAFRSVVRGLRTARPVTPKRVRRGGNTASFEMVARTERELVAAGRTTLPGVATAA